MLSFIKKRKEQKGFTLIEVMLVVAMIAMLASMTIPITFGSLKKQSVEEESSKLLGVLRQTQAKSMEGRGDSLWGVYFTPESYTVFKGNSYEEREPVYDEVFELSSGIGVAGAPEIVFSHEGISRIKGLVGHWTMNEGEGGVAHDLSGNDNHGTLVNDPTWVDGKAGGALDFDGSDDYVNTPLNGFPDPMTDITIGFWTSPSGVLENGSILLAVPDDIPNRINIHFPWGNGNLIWDFGNPSEGGELYTSWDSAWNNVWAHWVFISESGIGHKIYRNNVLLASNTTSSSFSKGTKSLDIAKYTRESEETTFWKGLIDDVRIYNRALTADEIRLMYESGLEGVDDNIIELRGSGEFVKINIGRQGRIEIVR